MGINQKIPHLVCRAPPHLKKLVNAFNRVEKDNEQESVQAYGGQHKRHWREDKKQRLTNWK